MQRRPEPEYMDLPEEAVAYANADFSEVNEAFSQRLLETVEPVSDVIALDLGTGPADIPQRLLRERPDWRIIAADAAFPMLKLAQRDIKKRPDAQKQIRLVQSDAKHLPFVNGAFNLIFSNSILHHIADVNRFWSELARVAAPGTWIFLRDLARPDTPEIAQDIVNTYAAAESRLLQEEFYRSLLAAYTPDEIMAQLDSAGLGNLSVTMVSDRHLDIVGIKKTMQ